ncbi:MAG: primosomal protein N' [Deltaproteobacteria bacterium]|nr:primosomal protein N' [Deltaproteobacteria bacterium]
MFIEVAINIPSDRSFTYAVPPEMADQAGVGKRVLVPLGRRRVTGYIIGLSSTSDIDGVRDILEILDMEPLFSDEDLSFYHWVSNYYIHPLGRTLREILPGGIDRENHLWITPSEPPRQGLKLSKTRRSLLSALAEHPRGISLKNLKKVLSREKITADIEALRSLQLVSVEDRLTKPAVTARVERFVRAAEAPGQEGLTDKQARLLAHIRDSTEIPLSELRRDFPRCADTLRRLERKGHIALLERECLRASRKTIAIGNSTGPVSLNGHQQAALDEIVAGLESGEYRSFLLHGVTGSGKTEVYLRAIEEALRRGGSALYLVPEIALTPQLLTRVTGRFDMGRIAVLHSGIGQGIRYDEWRRIQRGTAQIIIGARSAVFAPSRGLRLLIVDEEHDPSYKQDERLAYNARDLAVMRARMQEAVVILGSATPGINTYYHALEKDYAHLSLPLRVEERPLPRIEIVDMKQERQIRGTVPIFSGALVDAIGETLGAGNQALLFLNRRGFTTFLFCLDCGYVFRCRNCSVTMTHHAGDGRLRCHYCDYSLPAPPACPACSGTNVRSYGVGTEKVQEETGLLFPQGRIARLDSDTAARRGASETILSALDTGRIDILIGTQMITKGHDFPNVTLVGVVSADTSLNIPDFRAAERTFQLLTQVSGRGGRGDKPGRVIIQTFNPEHYAVTHAAAHDYRGFYEQEITARRSLGYPPFARLVNFRISGTGEDSVENFARELGTRAMQYCRSTGGTPTVEVLGPSPAPLARLKGKYRWQMLLRGRDVKTLQRVTRAILSTCDGPGPDIRVDVDPISFL